MEINPPFQSNPEFPPAVWRLLTTPPSPGAWNMAVDEAVLEAIGHEEVPPTLRLYAWQPPCLSLGYAQPFADVDLEALQQRGWDVVRRPTGGRAILHTDELTYSVTGPQNDPRLAGSVLESYRCLSQALLYALHLLHIPAQAEAVPGLVPDMSGAVKGPVCFEVPSNYEITVDGKKLVGSAQARRKEGVLQHGSLPLFGDLGRITKGLVYRNPTDRELAAQRVRQRAATAEEILGKPLSWEAAAQAFIRAFTEILNLKLEPGDLTPNEQARAAQLVSEKYANSIWTQKN